MALRSAVVLSVLIFAVTVLVRLPARWLAGLLPPPVQCEQPSGTLWNGACGELRAGTYGLRDVSWRVHPAALLRMRLAADLNSQDPAARGHGGVEVARSGEVAIRDLVASLPVQSSPGMLPVLVRGQLELALPAARIVGGRLAALRGRINVQQLQVISPPAELGGYELQFAPQPEGAPMLGELRDLNGPLSVNGRLRLTSSGAYELDGTVAARAQASADLIQALQLLGPPDAQGRRQFSLAGTL